MRTRGIAKWAKVQSPDTKYNCWSIVLEVDKEEAARLKAAGLKVKVEEVDDALVRTWKCTRYVKKRGKKNGGGQNPPPQVLDAALNPFTGLIGNGSEVIVLHKPYAWNNDFGSGVGSDFQGVQVLSLVEYVSEGEEEGVPVTDDDGEGFEVVVGGFVAGEEEEAPAPAPAKKKPMSKVADPDLDF